MAQEKRNFLGGLDKDLDTRLVKNGDYSNAINVRVASSTDGTVGAIENIEGNELVPTDFYSSSQEVLFVNSNGVYEEVNPTTVLHEKVIRISGWEEANNNYSFSLYSRMDDGGSRHIGDFSWNGSSDRKNTASYLISQFSEFSQFGTGIPIYDLNTWSEFTASVKLMTFNQYTELSGGYLEVVIQADISGVNFDIFGEFNGEGSGIYSRNTIPITNNGNVTLSVQGSFDTGSLSNTDTTDGGVVVSPDGNIVEADNRTVYQLSIIGIEPTSPADLTNITLFSYRENNYNASQTYDVEPLIEITDGLFDSGDTYPFDSNQNNLSKWLSFVFSTSKTIIANDIPISFVVPSSNFFTTFSSGDSLLDGGELKVTIVGPPGVRFRLALASNSESLASTLSGVTGNGSQYQALNSSGLTMIINPRNVLPESSIELSGSIYESYNEVSSDLENALTNVGELEQISADLLTQFTQSQANLTAQIALTDATQVNLDQAESDLDDANQVNENQQIAIDNAVIQLDTLNEEAGALETSYNNLVQTNVQLNDAVSVLGNTNLNLSDQLLDLSGNLSDLGDEYSQYVEDTNSDISGYQANIDDLSNQVSDFIGQGETTAQDIFLLQQQVASLLQQVEEVNISEIIVQQTFNRANQIYLSAEEDYISSINIYNSLSIPLPSSVYSQDFSPGDSYAGQVLRYKNVFTNGVISVAEASTNGYVEVPVGGYYAQSTALRIPKASFSGSEDWLPGRNISLEISFDALISANNQDKNCKVIITNLWDQSQDFDNLENQLLYQEFTVYSGTGGSVNTNPQTFNFIIPSDHDVNDLSLNNIVVIGLHGDAGGNINNRARITNISITSSNEGEGSLNNLYNESSDFREQYLETQTSVEQEILNISDDPDIIDEVSELLIPGFNENGSATLWDQLTLFLERSSEFSSSLQTYLYELYQSYSDALTTSQADVQALEDEYQENINTVNEELSLAQSEVSSLNQILNPLQGILFGSSSFISQNPYSLVDVLTISGVEPGLVDQSYITNSYIASGSFSIAAQVVINGETQVTDSLDLLTESNILNLNNNAHSSTNNVLHYIRQNINISGYQWQFDVPGFGTQLVNIYWSNFTQDENSMDGSSPSFNITEGIDLTYIDANFEEFSGSGGAQLLLSFENNVGSNMSVVNQYSGGEGFLQFVFAGINSLPRSSMIRQYGNNSYPYRQLIGNLSTISTPQVQAVPTVTLEG